MLSGRCSEHFGQRISDFKRFVTTTKPSNEQKGTRQTTPGIVPEKPIRTIRTIAVITASIIPSMPSHRAANRAIHPAQRFIYIQYAAARHIQATAAAAPVFNPRGGSAHLLGGIRYPTNFDERRVACDGWRPLCAVPARYFHKYIYIFQYSQSCVASSGGCGGCGGSDGCSHARARARSRIYQLSSGTPRSAFRVFGGSLACTAAPESFEQDM